MPTLFTDLVHPFYIFLLIIAGILLSSLLLKTPKEQAPSVPRNYIHELEEFIRAGAGREKPIHASLLLLHMYLQLGLMDKKVARIAGLTLTGPLSRILPSLLYRRLVKGVISWVRVEHEPGPRLD